MAAEPNPTAWDPWWLAWIVPITTLVGLIGGGIFYVVRRLLASYIQEEMSKVIDAKFKTFGEHVDAQFKDVDQQIERRHEDNQDAMDKLEREVARLGGRNWRPRG